jgi:hypothetical protein
MKLKFEFKKERESKSIITVEVDENGNIQNLSEEKGKIIKHLKKQPNITNFRKFVKNTVEGTICSDRLDIITKKKNTSYKIEQLP